MTENSNYVCSYVCLTNEIKGHFQRIHFVHLHQPNYSIQLSLAPRLEFQQRSHWASPPAHSYWGGAGPTAEPPIAACSPQCTHLHFHQLREAIKSLAIYCDWFGSGCTDSITLLGNAIC